MARLGMFRISPEASLGEYPAAEDLPLGLRRSGDLLAVTVAVTRCFVRQGEGLQMSWLGVPLVPEHSCYSVKSEKIHEQSLLNSPPGPRQPPVCPLPVDLPVDVSYKPSRIQGAFALRVFKVHPPCNLSQNLMPLIIYCTCLSCSQPYSSHLLVHSPTACYWPGLGSGQWVLRTQSRSVVWVAGTQLHWGCHLGVRISRKLAVGVELGREPKNSNMQCNNPRPVSDAWPETSFSVGFIAKL